MSGYKYGYDVAPARPTGWRSGVAGLVTVAVVVVVSATSGAVVTLDLIAPRSLHAKVSETAVATAPVTIPAASTPMKPKARQAVDETASAPARPAVDQKLAAQPVAPPPSIAAAPPAPEAAAAQAAAQPAPTVPDSELTFAKGYAQRRAVQAAAARSAAAHVASDNQLGRPAVAVRKPTYARTYGGQEHRVARSESARQDSFDFRRNRALAYGEQYQSRRQQGGFFGNFVGGGDLF